jgi:hypothetical protein
LGAGAWELAAAPVADLSISFGQRSKHSTGAATTSKQQQADQAQSTEVVSSHPVDELSLAEQAQAAAEGAVASTSGAVADAADAIAEGASAVAGASDGVAEGVTSGLAAAPEAIQVAGQQLVQEPSEYTEVEELVPVSLTVSMTPGQGNRGCSELLEQPGIGHYACTSGLGGCKGLSLSGLWAFLGQTLCCVTKLLLTKRNFPLVQALFTMPKLLRQSHLALEIVYMQKQYPPVILLPSLGRCHTVGK